MSTEFFAELKRRRVFRVAAIYAVVAWLIIQVAATVQPFLNLPPWVVTLVIVLVALGLPVTLVLGWAFDITPEGIRRDSSAPQATQTRRQMSIAAGILLLICLAAGALLFYLRRLPDDAAKAIAVLPFTSLSADRNNEYFADGIHEQVLDQLTQIPDLHVVSRTSVMRYRQERGNLREIARELDVNTILEGTVQRDSNRVRITAQLIDARTDRHLWSESYDRDLTDVFSIQSSIAQEIAAALSAELSAEQRTALAIPPTTNVQAYDLYLEARQHAAVTPADFEARIDLLRRALALDSTFALAQIELANHFINYADGFFVDSMAPAISTAVARGLRLAPASAEAHVMLSRVKARAGDDDGALAEAAIAREIQPGSADHLQRIGAMMTERGQYVEALRLLDQAIALKQGHAAYFSRAQANAGLRRWQEAEANLDQGTALLPNNPVWFIQKFRYRFARGDKPESLRALLADGIARHGQKPLVENFTRGSGELVPILLELRPDFFDQLSLTAGVDSVDYYLISGLVHQRNGRSAEARAAFEKDRLIGETKRRNVAADSSSFSVNQANWLHADLALAYAALGRHDDAVAAALHAVNRVPPRADRYLLFNVSWVLARVQMTAGRVDDAIDVLERVVAEATAPVYGFTTQRLRVDPMFAPLRASPRFQKLVSTP